MTTTAPNPHDRASHAAAAVRLLREAASHAAAAGAPRTLARIRSALKSAEGAFRHADNRRGRFLTGGAP